jgi:hypothetical protein
MSTESEMRLFCTGEGKTRKVNKLIAVPALALAAGLSLAAFGSSSSSHDDGLLTDGEFDAKRAEVIGRL